MATDERENQEIRRMLEDIRRRREAFDKLSPEEKVKVLIEKSKRLRERIDEFEIELEEAKHNRSQSVVSSNTVECHEWDDVHIALILIHNNGRVEVRCDGGCFDCKYADI